MHSDCEQRCTGGSGVVISSISLEDGSTDTKNLLIADSILLILNDAIFIKTSMKANNLKNKEEVDAGGKSDAGGDDYSMFFLRGLISYDEECLISS